MDALDVFRMLRRRWVLTCSLLAGLAVLLGAITFVVPVQYRASAMVLVLRQFGGQDQNPYAAVDKAQGQAALVLITVVNSPQVRRDLVAQGATANLEISSDSGGVSTTDSPFVSIVATGTNADAVRRSAQIALQRVRDELKRRQDSLSVPAEQQLTLTEILSPNEVGSTRAAQMRAAGIAGALGMVALLLIVVLYDRSRTRRAAAGPGPKVDPPELAAEVDDELPTAQQRPVTRTPPPRRPPLPPHAGPPPAELPKAPRPPVKPAPAPVKQPQASQPQANPTQNNQNHQGANSTSQAKPQPAPAKGGQPEEPAPGFFTAARPVAEPAAAAGPPAGQQPSPSPRPATNGKLHGAPNEVTDFIDVTGLDGVTRRERP